MTKLAYTWGARNALLKLGFSWPGQEPSTWDRVRKAGPGIGGLIGTGVGLALGRGKGLGKMVQHGLAGLGTGATLGWVPDMAHGVSEGLTSSKLTV